jgi:hypothetical protein
MTVCASPDTPIATPTGDVPIAALAVGDLVYSVAGDEIRAVPLRAVQRVEAHRHSVIRVVFENGAVLEISALHPTADGRTFGDLQAGDWLDGKLLVEARSIPYAFPYTYDILPDSESGRYFAAGAQIGTTMIGRNGWRAPSLPASR